MISKQVLRNRSKLPHRGVNYSEHMHRSLNYSELCVICVVVVTINRMCLNWLVCLFNCVLILLRNHLCWMLICFVAHLLRRYIDSESSELFCFANSADHLARFVRTSVSGDLIVNKLTFLKKRLPDTQKTNVKKPTHKLRKY